MRTNALPEPPIDPPYPDEATYARNMRNALRDEICEAISLIDDRLAELDWTGFTNFLHSLAELRDYLVRDMEV